MNYAYIDASWQEQPGGLGVGGWGLVLLLPGRLALSCLGQLDAPDNNAAELRAVLEAVRVAPAGQPLTVYTDNQAVLASVVRGRGPALLADQTQEIHQAVQAAGLVLHLRYAPRTGRHMQTAHALANEARRSMPGDAPPTPRVLSGVEVILEQRPGRAVARVSLRRANVQGLTERVMLDFTPDPQQDVPPSVQVFLAALTLARPGEYLRVRRASQVVQALWQRPERALRPQLQLCLHEARTSAQAQGIVVEFWGAPA